MALDTPGELMPSEVALLRVLDDLDETLAFIAELSKQPYLDRYADRFKTFAECQSPGSNRQP